jgi:hypothetical protein
MIKETRDSIVQISTDTLLSFHFSDIALGSISDLENIYSNQNFDFKNNYFISESGQILYAEKETTAVNYNLEIPKVIIRFSDTLKLNDLQYLKQGDTRSANELIVLHPQKETISVKNDLNGVCMGVEFGFMLICTMVYLLNSFTSWFTMFSKINFALKS